MDSKVVEKCGEDGYFTKDKKSEKSKSEEAFFKQGEKPEVRLNCLGRSVECIKRLSMLTVHTEEADCKREGGGPEGRGQGVVDHDQEDPVPAELPALDVHPEERR